MASSTERDRGLRRVSLLTRWAAAVAVIVAGGFSAAAAKALPGRSKSASSLTPTTTPSSTSLSPSVDDNGTSQPGGGLVPPAQAPQPASGSGSVVSGAS